MIDPLAVPVPPELGPTIYGWVRRLALQAELETADRVLRDALLEVSSSLSVSIIYPGQDGLWSLGPDEEIPREAGPIVAVAQARRAVVASHTALIPIVTSTETVAVILLTRNPRNPAYQPIETLAMLGLARESAAILHHLAVLHLQKSHEQKLDRGGLYRPEALEAHRSRGQEGVPIHITPAWARRTFPFLVGAVIVALLFSIFIRVPTYSSGRGVVTLEGETVTTQAQGTVEKIYLLAGTEVVKGTPLIKLGSKAEEDAVETATRNLENWAHQFLLENADPNVKQQLAQAKLDLQQAKSKLEARTIRATKPGVISDISAVLGQLINPGEPVATIIDPVATRPLVIAYLPSKDGPNFKPGMELQVGLDGYTKTREKAKIISISREGIGAAQATKQMGPTLADGLRLAPDATYIRVVAELPSRTFIDDHRKLSYRHGMTATTEVKISSKPFLVDMFPALERYVPQL